MELTYGKSTTPNAQPFDVPYPFPVRQLQNDVRIVVQFEHHRVTERNNKKKVCRVQRVVVLVTILIAIPRFLPTSSSPTRSYIDWSGNASTILANNRVSIVLANIREDEESRSNRNKYF